MAQFKFRLPTLAQIRNSNSGSAMLYIINADDHDEKFTLVTGCPGSGKTTVSIFRLIQLSNNNRPSILLTHQRMLRTAIENLVAQQGISRSKVNTVHSWFYAKTGRLLGFAENRNKMTASEIENVLRGKVSDTELILDEAQDLEERILKAFPNVFNRITIGADNDQLMRNGSNEETIKSYIDYSMDDFILQFNYRNTYQTYNFARYFVPDSEKAHDPQTLSELQRRKNDGDLPEVLQFNSSSDMHSRLKTILAEYIIGSTIGVLLPYQNQVESYYNIISGFGRGFECSKYYSEMSNPEKERTENDLKSILVTTFVSAKGMEFDIVIMPEFESIPNTVDAKREVYVGCTRTRSRLIIMYRNEYLGGRLSILKDFPQDTYDTDNLFGNTQTLRSIPTPPLSTDYPEVDDLPF